MESKSFAIKTVVNNVSGVKTIVFDTRGNKFWDYKPGQYITVEKYIDGKKERRAYSLCTAPGIDDYPAITVKKMEEGNFSTWINEELKSGDEITLLQPDGSFTVAPVSGGHYRDAYFFAGGSGITPIMSQIKHILANEPKANVKLIYASRSESDIIFRAEIDALDKQYESNFQVVNILSQPLAPWNGLSGRLTPENLSEILDGWELMEHSEFYVCGPQGLMQSVFQVLASKGIGPHQIRKESFVAPLPQPIQPSAQQIAQSQGPFSVTIDDDGDTFEIEVDAHQKILDVAEEFGIDMPFSCRSGVCCTCRVKLIEGEVVMETNAGLDPAEQAEGYILACQAMPVKGPIKIELE